MSSDVASTVQEFKSGKFEFRCDKQGIVHVPFGKLSFEAPVRCLAGFGARAAARPCSACVLGHLEAATLRAPLRDAARSASLLSAHAGTRHTPPVTPVHRHPPSPPPPPFP